MTPIEVLATFNTFKMILLLIMAGLLFYSAYLRLKLAKELREQSRINKELVQIRKTKIELLKKQKKQPRLTPP